MQRIHNYINGQACEPLSGRWLPVFEPAIGQIYAEAPDSDEADVNAAVAAAQAAFDSWSQTDINTRERILSKIADGISAQADALALAESKDSGKPLALAARMDIPRAAANFRFFAQAITQFASESHDMGTEGFNYTLRQPLGPVVCISPWNLPLYLFTWKIAPALAAGNTVVAKPSEITPMTAYLLGQICTDAGLPPGVLNIVHGYGSICGAQMVQHPQIKAVSFTGSTRVGQEIARVAAPQFKKISLELGGKNPSILFADANYETMLDTAVRAAFTNQGQICLCGSRILVEASLYERFKTDFVERVQRLRVGSPYDPATQVGAVASAAHLEKIATYCALAQEEGGTVCCGGQIMQPQGAERGWYFAPTVIEGLGAYCRTNQEEIFGPVVTLMPFHSDEEALALANSTPYGLSATVWTNNLQRAHHLARHLQAGIVWVNTWLKRDLRTPFGGVKSSGVGREGGWEALRFFTDAKNVCIGMDTP